MYSSQRRAQYGDLAADLETVHNVSQHARGLVRARKEAQTVFYSITNPKFIQACTLIRQALVEQQQAHGESLLAAELLDALQQPTPPPIE